MGYTSGWSSLPELIEYRLRDESHTSASGFTVKRHTIAHKYVPIKGDPEFKGALWYVAEHTGTAPDGKSGTERFIALDLIGQHVPHGRRHAVWGYTDLDESGGPHEVSCPLSFLKLAPVAKGPFAAKWRERVVAYHAEQKARRVKLVVGDRVKLVEGLKVSGLDRAVLTEATIIDTKPLAGVVEIDGLPFNLRLKRCHIAAKLPRVNATV